MDFYAAAGKVHAGLFDEPDRSIHCRVGVKMAEPGRGQERGRAIQACINLEKPDNLTLLVAAGIC